MEVVDSPVLACRWALACRTARLVATIPAGIALSVLALQGGEVWCLADGVAVDVDETVSAPFFGIFVDKTTGVDRGHLARVESLNFFEGTLVGDAAEFREEDRDAVTLK